VATLVELARDHTALRSGAIAHLQRLVRSWDVLSDLCFGDLLLLAPLGGSTTEGQDPSFIVLGQVRPTSAQTLHLDDLIGRVFNAKERPQVARAWALASMVEGELPVPSRGETGRVVCVPVRWRGQVVAILSRESALIVGRRPGEHERVSVEVFDRFVRMISDGDFPFPADDVASSEAPRVTDGMLVLDALSRVAYASPNAINALHRIGTYSSIDGMRLDEVGVEETAVSLAWQTKIPVTEEVERGQGVTVLVRCIPMLDHGEVSGGLVLLRDITELRVRDRLLLSKDAAIREVHHRVKNNLQTISSLLRLQARRLTESEGRSALEEAERRVRSIALVHEILSRDTTDQVDFNEILPSLVRMAEDLRGPENPFAVHTSGMAGELPAEIATPLAVVLTELLQNAAEHAFPEGSGPSSALGLRKINMVFDRDGDTLAVEVSDNGVGLPVGFSVDKTTSLGLSIVRDLVRSQLEGTISMFSENGTVVRLVMQVKDRAGDPERLSLG
jgi:two-component sensor histidine kinase